MKVVTSAEMREIDRAAIESYHIPGVILMEHAALAVCRVVKETSPPVPVGIICGRGNNGGDGWAVARLLSQSGWEVTVYHPGMETDLPPDAKVNREIALSLGIPAAPWAGIPAAPEVLKRYGILVDALLGTGFRGTVTGDYARIIELINSSQRPVISVDIPSGVEADTGRTSGPAVRACKTVTFGLPKVGLMVYPGREAAGEVIIDRIGLPAKLLAEENPSYYTFTPEEVEAMLPGRGPLTHKGNCGHLLVVGGSEGMTGAVVLAGLAALRSGAGLVTLGVRDHLPVPEKPPELMIKKWSSLNWRNYKAVVAGPGLSAEPDGRELVKELLSLEGLPRVFDADALNLLAQEEGWWKRVKGPLILTPHPGEMARLCGLTTGQVQENRLELVRSKAELWGVILVLKGAATLVGEPGGPVYINTTGNPGLATGGTGDVLTGVIGALLAQGVMPIRAAALGVYLHGAAGDLAAGELGYAGMLAGDLLPRLPQVFKRVSHLRK